LFDLYTFDPRLDERWPRFLDRRADASIFHTPGWLEALRSTYGYEPVVYTSSSPGTELNDGLLFCRINTWLSGKRLVSVPFSDHAALLTDDGSVLRRMFSLLEEQVNAKACKYIEIRPVLQVHSDLLGFATSSRFYLHKLSLDKNLAALFESFHKNSVQRKIRRAEREGLTYKEGRSEELIQQFYRLLLPTHRRHGLPPQPISWFRNLVTCLGEKITIRVASSKDRDVASIITLTHKNRMVYKYGCSDTRFHNLGGMAFLFWRAIQDAKSGGLEELDMGRSDCDNAGLISFKEHWGAKRNTIDYLGYPAKSRPNHNLWHLKAARKVFALLPTAVLPPVGQLLYRHMG
jgi:CelD/BcsL family acetyltransferase involved in cellulose biosynthesis